jgi:hypothetical protein
LPAAYLDKKDLAILHLELCQVIHKITAERVGASLSTVEHRLRRINRLFQPIGELFPHSSTSAILNAAGLDTFILANPEWLAYPVN